MKKWTLIGLIISVLGAIVLWPQDWRGGLFFTVLIIAFCIPEILKLTNKKKSNATADFGHTYNSKFNDYTINTSIRGISHYGSAMRKILQGDIEYRGPVTLHPDPDNQYDPDAIGVFIQDNLIGYIPKEQKDSVYKIWDRITNCYAIITRSTNDSGQHYYRSRLYIHFS